MSLPAPEPGLVISYAYVWRREHEAGQEEASKTRPCVIVLGVESRDRTTRVTVAPVTHRQPTGTTIGIPIPPRVKQHLGLDHAPSWVIVSEVNQFVWPGYDLQPIPGGTKRFDYGFLPPRLFENSRSAMLDCVVSRRVRITSRD